MIELSLEVYYIHYNAPCECGNNDVINVRLYRVMSSICFVPLLD